MSNIMWFLNLNGLLFLVVFPVFTTCGAPLAECTLAQPRKTPAVFAPMKFKPHNPPILWNEVGVGCNLWKGIWYLYGPRVSMF